MTTTKADSYASVVARERYIPRGLANTHAIFVARAEGSRVSGRGRQTIGKTIGNIEGCRR
jgi:hypothetical protein